MGFYQGLEGSEFWFRLFEGQLGIFELLGEFFDSFCNTFPTKFR